MGDLSMYSYWRQFGPSSPSFLTLCSKKGVECLYEYWRTWLGLSFKLSTIINWLKLSSRCLARCLIGQLPLHAAAARMDLQTDILQQIGIWTWLYVCASCNPELELSFDVLSTFLEWNWTPKDMCRITRRRDWLLHGLFHILADWRRFPRSNCISETTLQGKAPPFHTGNWFYSCSLATRSFMWWRVLRTAHLLYNMKLQKLSIYSDLTSRISLN